MEYGVVEEIGKFDGGYGRHGVIDIRSDRTCSLCGGQKRLALCSDGSEDEYAGAAICSDCLKKILEKMLAREGEQGEGKA